jgi:hypothetical protein
MQNLRQKHVCLKQQFILFCGYVEKSSSVFLNLEIVIVVFDWYQVKPDDYDKLMKEMVFELRGHASDRSKSVEELDKEERTRLEDLEVCPRGEFLQNSIVSPALLGREHKALLYISWQRMSHNFCLCTRMLSRLEMLKM